MKVKRIDSYNDPRFSLEVLKQHGAFEAGSLLYEVETISNFEAIIRGPDEYMIDVIEEFRYYAEHITKFYNENKECIIEYEPVEIFNIKIEQIQPSQLYVDIDKKKALIEFMKEPEDIIIPVIPFNNRYISLDGHTRLSLAIDQGFKTVKGFISDGGNWVNLFVNEAIKRDIRTPYDMKVLSHDEYEIKWNQFCYNVFNDQGEDI